MSREVFGSELRQSVKKAIQGVGNNMQFNVYDPSTGEVGRLAKKASLRAELEHAVRDQAMDLEREAASINPSEVRFLDYLVAPYKQCPEKPRALAEIAAPDISRLFGSVIRVGKQEAGRISLGQTAVRTVFGASESTPVRALSYLLPGLHLVEAMRRSNKFSQLPQIQYIVMGETATRMNGLSEDDVRRNVGFLTDIGHRYVSRYYPEIAESVLFIRDDGFLDHPEVVRGREELEESDAVRGHQLFPTVSQELGQLGTVNAYEYAALHPLVHDMTYEVNPFTTASGDEPLIHRPDLLINIGGQMEKVFYKARVIFRDILADQGVSLIPSVQLFSCHKVPPYAPLSADGDRLSDITFDDVVDAPRAFFMFDMVLAKDAIGNNLLSRDYMLLYQDSFHDFSNFLSDAVSDIRKNKQADTN